MARYGTIISTGPLAHNRGNECRSKARVIEVNPDLEKVVDAFEQSSGIRCRWYAPRDWATSDLAALAGQEAIKKAGIKPERST